MLARFMHQQTTMHGVFNRFSCEKEGCNGKSEDFERSHIASIGDFYPPKCDLFTTHAQPQLSGQCDIFFTRKG